MKEARLASDTGEGSGSSAEASVRPAHIELDHRAAGAPAQQGGGRVAGHDPTLVHDRHSIRHELGLDRPILEQLLNWLVNLGTGIAKVTVTGSEGAYQFPALPPGRYRVEFNARDFRTQVNNEVVFRVGDEKRIDVALEPGESRESVTVRAEAPLIETERAKYPHEKMAVLPTMGGQTALNTALALFNDGTLEKSNNLLLVSL